MDEKLATNEWVSDGCCQRDVEGEGDEGVGKKRRWEYTAAAAFRGRRRGGGDDGGPAAPAVARTDAGTAAV